MKERRSVAFLAGGLCFLVAAFRMIAPEIPFDWMTLTLVLAAAAALMLPALTVRPNVTEMETNPIDLVPLTRRMAQIGWKAGSGGLFDALLALFDHNPFSALCAARGMIAMLSAKAELSPATAETLDMLTDALDSASGNGKHSTDAGDVQTLFSHAMRALGMLDAQT
ncbi:MAG: hypothetical protein FWG37_04645 [Clostridia bacterium]|nr:hypothetical protein [Clostridia bacterium]